MKKSIFRRIFILYFLIILLSGIFGEIYITSAVRENYLDHLKENLSAEINLISAMVSFKGGNLDSFCRQIKASTSARVTAIKDDGTVIGDSDTTSSLMENHANRPEIEQASLLGTGSSVRFSDTLKYNFLYVAKRIANAEGTEGFIRLAVPLKAVDASVNLLRIRIVAVVVIILFITALFSVWQTDNLRRLLGQITRFSRSLSRGEIDKRLFLKNAGEFDEIAENLTSMSVKLGEVMKRDEEEKSRLGVILKSIPDALLIIDPKGNVILSSSSAKEFFGNIVITGRQFVDIVRNHEFSDLLEEVRATLSPAAGHFTIETPWEKSLAVRVSPLFYKEEELSGFVAIFHDITQIEKLEQVRKDFVANVSHEIKTPITAIKGFADTLLEGAINDKDNAVNFLERIRSNSERINSLVDDLMTISKIELGVIVVQKMIVDIDAVFRSILDIFTEKAAAKNISLSASNRAGLRKISADKNRLLQIMTNLVENAVKFTDKGGVNFGLDKDDGKTFLFVDDTGIGIPGYHLPRLGERFYRVDPSRSRQMGGTGLGLAIVKHLVKAHGWDMNIESTPGKGTRIRIFV